MKNMVSQLKTPLKSIMIRNPNTYVTAGKKNKKNRCQELENKHDYY